MADDLCDVFARLRAAWMAGGSARKHCPPEWLSAVGDGPRAELALAALAGHALQTVFRPVPGSALVARERLPALALPPVPDDSRPRVRRMMFAHPWMLPRLLAFLASRGATMHPADWLPTKRGEPVPALYAPWVEWANPGAAPQKPKARASDDVEASARELAEMLELSPAGLLRRRRLEIPQLKTAPQNARRQTLLAQVPLDALAAALGASAADLVRTAPAGAEPGVAAFVALVAATGGADACRILLAAMLDDADCPLAGAPGLAASLDRAQVASLLPAALRREDDPGFRLALDLAGEALGLAQFSQIAAAPAFSTLRENLSAADLDRAAQAALSAGLAALGLLATAGAAESLIDTCLQAGVSPADPRLDALQLNAALIPEASA